MAIISSVTKSLSQGGKHR